MLLQRCAAGGSPGENPRVAERGRVGTAAVGEGVVAAAILGSGGKPGGRCDFLPVFVCPGLHAHVLSMGRLQAELGDGCVGRMFADCWCSGRKAAPACPLHGNAASFVAAECFSAMCSPGRFPPDMILAGTKPANWTLRRSCCADARRACVCSGFSRAHVSCAAATRLCNRAPGLNVFSSCSVSGAPMCAAPGWMLWGA